MATCHNSEDEQAATVLTQVEEAIMKRERGESLQQNRLNTDSYQSNQLCTTFVLNPDHKKTTIYGEMIATLLHFIVEIFNQN